MWNVRNLPTMLQYNPTSKGSIASGLNHFLAVGGGGDIEMEKTIIARNNMDEEDEEDEGDEGEGGGFIRMAAERRMSKMEGKDDGASVSSSR